MTFTVLSGITHWNLVALHKTIDYLFPTPALVDRPGSEVVGSSCEGERRLPCPLRRDQSRRVPCLLHRPQDRQKAVLLSDLQGTRHRDENVVAVPDTTHVLDVGAVQVPA